MRQCYWSCFRLFKYFFPDSKAGQVSPLVPQAILRSLIEFPLCFVFVHNSQPVGKYLSTHRTLGIRLGPGGSTAQSQQQSRKGCDGEMQADTGQNGAGASLPTLRSQKGFPEEVSRPKLQG